MSEYIIPIKGVISSTVKVQAASLEDAIDHALANPPESSFGLADFDGVDEWLLSGGHYVDGEHVAHEPAEEPFSGVTPELAVADVKPSKPASVLDKILPELLGHLNGKPVAVALVSDSGHHVFATWGGTMEANTSAMVKATAGIAANSKGA